MLGYQVLTDLPSDLGKENADSIDSFPKLFEKTLIKYAPLKTVTIRGNNKPHMSKPLRKAIMLRTKLKNRSIKTRNNLDIQRYCHQPNLVVKSNKHAKCKYYENLNLKATKDIKSFWKKCKSLFSNSMVNGKIVLTKHARIIKDEKEISQYFNTFSATILDSLNILRFSTPQIQHTEDIVCDAIQKYASHPSILKIKGKASINKRFEFSSFDPTLAFSEINKLDPSKRQVMLYQLTT